ncbi:helix-turn-helix domain-containing protein [Patescibacteria group bacterium]|nr:helix-turn-helix domain-containing protein [Patescibacteria group bacterium]MBP9709786.1 helix-turn-helix domain-containing protein [Patescibacteria group bacterium]
MIDANMQSTSHQANALRQQKTPDMIETAQKTLEVDLDFLNLKEVATILRVAPISVYRLIARRAIPVYRACRKILFKRTDVLEYLSQHRKDPARYGSPKA